MREANPSSRTVLLHGGIYTASRFLNQGVVFLLLPVYAHLLGSQGVGVVEIMNVVRTFFGIALGQGLEAAWLRLRFDHVGAERKKLESSIALYLLASSVVFIFLVYALGDIAGSALTPGFPFTRLAVLSATTASAALFASLLERTFQSDQRPLAFAVWSLVRTTLTLLAIVFFVAVLRRGAPGKIEGETISAILAGALALLLLRPALGASRERLKQALGYGLPLVPHATAAFVNDQIDRFVVNAILGLQAVGVYSMGYRLAGVAMTMVVAQNQAFSPVFIETLRRAETEENKGRRDTASSLKERLASLGFMNVVVGCTVAQLVAAGAREVLFLATTPEFGDSWRVVAPVSAGVVSWTWYATLSQSVMFRTETVRRLPIITIGAAVANLGANLALVPYLNIDGAAWATFVSNSVLAVGAFYFARRSVIIPYAFRRWAIASACAGVSLAVIWQLDANIGSFLPRVLAKALLLPISVGVMLKLSGVRARALLRGAFRREPPGTTGEPQ